MLQPITVDTGSADEKGLLVLFEGKLVAVLVQLSDEHEAETGMWHLEAGFGHLAFEHPTFANLFEAQGWLERQLMLAATE